MAVNTEAVVGQKTITVEVHFPVLRQNAVKIDGDSFRQSLINLSTHTSVSVPDIRRISPEGANTGITAALDECTQRLSRPYLKILNFLALRPPPSCRERCDCRKISFNFYRLVVVIIVICGYLLQYMSCFRRDGGFGYKEYAMFVDKEAYETICHGSFMFSYIAPYLLHFCGYIHALYSFNVRDDDQLQCLLERVYLYTTNLRDGNKGQKKIIRISYFFIALNFTWFAFSSITSFLMMTVAHIEFSWIPYQGFLPIIVMKGFLYVCTLWHDAIQATIIINYCVQAQMLMLYLQFMRERTLMYPFVLSEWMKEVTEFRILLKFFNEQLAPAVSLLTIVNLTWSISGIFWLFNFDHVDKENIPIIGISISNVLLWITIAIVPFIQAARLTNACEKLSGIGHEVRTRAFTFQDSPDYKLDSILLYASTLKLGARLYSIPISRKYLCTFIVFCTVTLLVLGQLHYITAFE